MAGNGVIVADDGDDWLLCGCWVAAGWHEGVSRRELIKKEREKKRVNTKTGGMMNFG
jgi:hypothetical protein